MNVYILLTSALYCIVNFFLLLGTARMLRQPAGWLRALAGAFFGGIYTYLSLFLGQGFTNNILGCIFNVICMAVITYGFGTGWITSAAVFSIMNLAIGGVSYGWRGVLSLLLGTIGVFLICLISNKPNADSLIPVELSFGGKDYHLTALKDTGNMLTDPLTGNPVLIVGADIAQSLTGLSPQQLRTPIESLSLFPGLRLIPYRTVGQTGVFMLAMRISDIRIGSWKGSAIVVLSPELLSARGKFQALTGGYV